MQEDSRFAEHYALRDRVHDAFRRGLCTAHINRGDGEEVPAAYEWTHRAGSVSLLCAPCCAAWRANGVDDPTLAPERVRCFTRAIGAQ